MTCFYRCARRLGRRGAFLASIGMAWMGLGYSVLSTPVPSPAPAGLTVILTVMPLHAWGWLWFVAGAIGVAFSPVRKVGRDQPGFTALAVPTAAWSAGYLVDWIFIGGNPRGWVTAMIYAALAASIVIAAGWAEVRRRA